MSWSWQNTPSRVHPLKKMVPEPRRPRRQSSSPRCQESRREPGRGCVLALPSGTRRGPGHEIARSGGARVATFADVRGLGAEGHDADWRTDLDRKAAAPISGSAGRDSPRTPAQEISAGRCQSGGLELEVSIRAPRRDEGRLRPWLTPEPQGVCSRSPQTCQAVPLRFS